VFIYRDECKRQVNGFPNARHKKFSTKSEADDFVQQEKATTQQEVLLSSSTSPATSYHKTVSSARVVNEEINRAIGSRLPYRSAILIPPLNHTNLSADLNLEDMGGTSSRGLKRSFSTTAKLDIRSLKVTEDRVTGAKRMKMDHAVNAGVDLTKFQVDEEGYVQVFTDGACSSNGRRGAKAGIGVFFGDDNSLYVLIALI
jgi:ribonuclease HI